MPDRPPYVAHWLFGLMKWHEVYGQYRRVNSQLLIEGSLEDCQAEADRLNAEAGYRKPLTGWVQLVPGEF